MASEIGYLEVKCFSKDDMNVIKDVFNSFMKENSDLQEDITDKSISTIVNNGLYKTKNDLPVHYSFHVDIWNLFEDPMEAPLLDLAKQFIMKCPESEFNIIYHVSWDNSGETLDEEYEYRDHILNKESIFDPHEFDDEDFDEEEDFFFDDEPSESAIITNTTYEYNGSEIVEKK